MNCHLLSDIHLEFGDFDLPKSLGEKQRVIILAGDIDTPNSMEGYGRLVEFIEGLCSRFKHVIYVAGNHEYYGGEISDTDETLKLIAENRELDNLSVLQNDIVTIDNISFIGATLWTNFEDRNPLCMHDSQCGMMDFARIKEGGDLITAELIADTFEKSRDFIFESVIEENLKGNKTVVISHHGPSPGSVHPMYARSGLNGAFSSNLDQEITAHRPNVWCHGHTHSSFVYKIGHTMVYCNPRGYVGHEYNGIFNFTFNFRV